MKKKPSQPLPSSRVEPIIGTCLLIMVVLSVLFAPQSCQKPVGESLPSLLPHAPETWQPPKDSPFMLPEYGREPLPQKVRAA